MEKKSEKTIENLPHEVLEDIFKYLSKKQLKNVALMNKAFHEAVCHIEKFKFLLIVETDLVNMEKH
jgi:hypothetical protein